MNPEIKQKWVSALRSGQYKQTTDKLRNCEGFCCLGVLTDLMCKETNPETDQDTWFNSIAEELEGDENLAPSVAKWAGFDEDTVNRQDIVVNNGVYISGINDRGASFLQIADIIEEQL